jgi:hypothetical protein
VQYYKRDLWYLIVRGKEKYLGKGIKNMKRNIWTCLYKGDYCIARFYAAYVWWKDGSFFFQTNNERGSIEINAAFVDQMRLYHLDTKAVISGEEMTDWTDQRILEEVVEINGESY